MSQETFSQLTKDHPGSKLWLYSLSTDAVTRTEIFQHFLFLCCVETKTELTPSPYDSSAELKWDRNAMNYFVGEGGRGRAESKVRDRSELKRD